MAAMKAIYAPRGPSPGKQREPQEQAMSGDLTTTNILLGILTTISVLEALW
jgi:hypothetical protein